MKNTFRDNRLKTKLKHITWNRPAPKLPTCSTKKQQLIPLLLRFKARYSSASDEQSHLSYHNKQCR